MGLSELTFGDVLWDNVLRDTGVTSAYSGTLTSGKPIANATDWRDFSSFYVEANAATTLDFTLAADTAIDSHAIYCARIDTSGGSGTITIAYESAPSTFTTLDTFSFNDSGLLRMREFTEVTVLSGRKIRYSFNTNNEPVRIRQLAVGPRLVFPMGQHIGITPPNLLGGVVFDQNIGVNGSILGRSVRRTERSASIDMNYLEPAFVRGDWENLATHASKYPFFWRWNPVDYPDEAVFAAAENIVQPENSDMRGKMRVNMPLRCLTSDDNDEL